MDLWAKSFDITMRPLERGTFRRYREWLVPKTSGSLLEIGSGTGANLPYLPCGEVKELTLSDVSLHEEALRERLEGSCFEEAEMVEASTERLPFPDGAFDAVLATLVFCSVPDHHKGLREVRRVLKPGGRFYFLEHVLPEVNYLAVPMKLANPLWKLVADGCHLNRRTAEAIETAGMRIEKLRRDTQGVLIAGWARS